MITKEMKAILRRLGRIERKCDVLLSHVLKETRKEELIDRMHRLSRSIRKETLREQSAIRKRYGR